MTQTPDFTTDLPSTHNGGPPTQREMIAFLGSMREPSGFVTDAMAAARRAAEGRNGHGHYAFRDMWMAGVDAAIREASK